jgi:hypothetical protein
VNHAAKDDLFVNHARRIAQPLSSAIGGADKPHRRHPSEVGTTIFNTPSPHSQQAVTPAQAGVQAVGVVFALSLDASLRWHDGEGAVASALYLPPPHCPEMTPPALPATVRS